MKKIYIHLILFTSFLSISKAYSQAMVYYNNFNKESPGWVNYDDALSNAQILNGKYLLTHKQNTSSIIAKPIVVDYGRDFAIESIITHISGADNNPIGITFGGTDPVNLYYFCISATGQFTVAEFRQAVNKTYVNWQPSPAILKGSKANKLRIEKSENQYKYYINDVQVATTPVLQRFGDQIGLMVSGQQTAGFDFLKVIYLEQEDSRILQTVSSVSPQITQMAYQTNFMKDDENEWVLPKTDSVVTSISNGTFIIAKKSKLGVTESVTAATTKFDIHRDYLIETDAIHYSGDNNYGYGLDFSCDSIRQYHFWIASDYFIIGYTKQGVYNNILPWTPSLAIKKLPNSHNKLSIKHKAGLLYFYINDVEVINFPEFKTTGYQVGLAVASDQSVGFKYLKMGYLDQPPVIHTIAENDMTPPEVVITSPIVTRGLNVVESDRLHVSGIAKDPSGIFSVRVNEYQAKVETDGTFNVDIPLGIGENPLMVQATNNKMIKGTYQFKILRNTIPVATQTAVEQSAMEGKYYALLIGVQDYKDPSIQSLEGPVGDATNFMKALSNYSFEEKNITLLKNPTRDEFLQSLDNLSTKLGPEDNLIIFYAGHGYYDDVRHQGYWFPSDANKTKRDTWISNREVIDEITAINSKHTLLISDACFSGSIFKSRGIEMATKDIQELYKQPSRKALTSGNMKEVPDNSVFMKYLINSLNQNTNKFLSSEQLYMNFKPSVMINSPMDQIPQYGEIREAGGAGGDFIFIKKN